MTPFEWFAVGSMLVSAFVGLGGTFWSNHKNEQLQREAWERQSIASRVNELKESGLNKQLATGMNPNYNMQTSFESPDFNLGKLADFVGHQSERENIRQATVNAKKQESILSDNAREAKAKADVAVHDATIQTSRPYASTDPAFVRNISGIKDLILGSDNGVNSGKDLFDRTLDFLYKMGDKHTQKFIDRNRYEFEKKGGTSKYGKDPAYHFVPQTPSGYNSSMTSSNTRGWQAQKMSGGRYIQR